MEQESQNQTGAENTPPETPSPSSTSPAQISSDEQKEDAPPPVEATQNPDPKPSAASDTTLTPAIPPEPPAISPQVQNRTFLESRILANLKRSQKKAKHIAQIEEFAAQKGKITNGAVRDLLRISQSSASNYLKELHKTGRLQKFGRGRASYYKK